MLNVFIELYLHDFFFLSNTIRLDGPICAHIAYRNITIGAEEHILDEIIKKKKNQVKLSFTYNLLE